MRYEIQSTTQSRRLGACFARRRASAVRRALALCVLVGVVSGLAALPALASPVGGATYRGRTTDGAYVVFTVSADGRTMVSYEITGAIGNGCEFSGVGGPPAFPGAPITHNAFSYRTGHSFSFAGVFPGAQSATGTYHFHTDAIGQQKTCDSGVVQWSATTTAKPTATTTAKATFATHVSLRRMTRARLGGRITSKAASCTSKRTVSLWLGRRKLRSTRSATNGTFWFARTSSLGRRRVHVSVAGRTVTAAVCGAASSKSLRA